MEPQWRQALDWRFSNRVRRAMARLSRDRWLPPSEVRRIGLALSRAKSAAPCHVFYHAIPIECTVVGMLRGQRPFAFDTKEAAKLRKYKTKGAAADMLFLLELSATSTKKDIAYEYDW